MPPSFLSDFESHRLRRLLDRATDVLGQALSTLSRQLVADAVANPDARSWASAQGIIINHTYGTTLRMAALDNTDFTAASDAPRRSQILIALDLGTQRH